MPLRPQFETHPNLTKVVTYSKDEVDAVMAQAAKAGATITKAAGTTFWGGYAGYFQDPDGHLWEILWNPAWKIGE